MIWVIFVCVCNIAICLMFLLTCFYRMSVLWIVTISCSKEKLAMKRTFWRAHRLPRNTVQWNYAKNKYYKLSDRNTRTQRSGQWTQHTGLGVRVTRLRCEGVQFLYRSCCCSDCETCMKWLWTKSRYSVLRRWLTYPVFRRLFLRSTEISCRSSRVR